MRSLIRSSLTFASFALLTTLALLASSMAVAGNFSVSPVRLFMKPTERVISLTIINHGDTVLTLETELTSWKQNQDGSFNQQPTEDVIVAPPQMRLAAKARQVVRVARVIPATSGAQMTYRLLVREVPEAGPPKPGYNVNLALAFSIPIFITPPGLKHDVSCKLASVPPAPPASAPKLAGMPEAPKSWMIARCDNAGNTHALITSIKLLDTNGAELAGTRQPGYTLVNSGRNFEIFKTTDSQALPQSGLRLSIIHDDNTQQSVNVALPQ